MNQEKFKVSGRLFRSILTQMDSLSREDLITLQTEGAELNPDLCSRAFYHAVQALRDLARVELVNRDLIDI